MDGLHSRRTNLQTCTPPLPQTTSNNFFPAKLILKYWTKENRGTLGSAKASSVTSGRASLISTHPCFNKCMAATVSEHFTEQFPDRNSVRKAVRTLQFNLRRYK